jgi:hypothetical protein
MQETTRIFRSTRGARAPAQYTPEDLKPTMPLLFAKKIKKCPRCESHLVRRSARRGFVERFLYPLLFLWPYRCDECDVRFLGFRRQYARPRQACQQTAPAPHG